MNKRIEELAEQAGLVTTWEGWVSTHQEHAEGVSDEFLERFADLVRQDLYQVIGKSVIEQINSAVQMEREACAKLCEKVHDDYINDRNNDGYDWPDGRNCAEAIRARSKHD